MFLDNVTLRRSCYSCRFPQNHASDITLLDYWSAVDDDDKGVSAIILNNEKGARYFNSTNIKHTSAAIFPSSIAGACISHANLGSYKYSLFNRTSFFKAYNKHDMDWIINTWYPRYKKISLRIAALRKKAYATKTRVKMLLGKGKSIC